MTKNERITICPYDIVELSLGGPQMLVEMIDAENIAYCVWFNVQKELQKERFHVDALLLVRKGENVGK